MDNSLLQNAMDNMIYSIFPHSETHLLHSCVSTFIVAYLIVCLNKNLIMKALTYVLLITLILTSCGLGDRSDVIEGYEAESHYTIDVESSLGGSHSFTRIGDQTTWAPDIGHMELGPEEPFNCVDEVISLWMTMNPTLLNTQNGAIDTSSVNSWSLYSILYWCEDLGNQESNWYDYIKMDSIREQLWGIDENGVEFIHADLQFTFTRSLINMADVPETITVNAYFTATNK